MMIIDGVIVSDELRDARFCCDLKKCLGTCCVEGDAGAPLEEAEIAILEDILDDIKPYMRREGIEVLEKGGVFDFDASGAYVTPLIKDRDCAYAYYEGGVARCAIEKAYQEGKTSFQKPISCHLYPVRISKNEKFEAVNYHKWYICNPARSHGKKTEVLLYRFLKDALVRNFGEKWYNKLVAAIEKKT